MKISELIKDLENFKNHYGDMEIYVSDYADEMHYIDGIFGENNYAFICPGYTINND